METIDHLFLNCSLARFVWNVLKCAFSLPVLLATVAEPWDTWMPNFRGETKNLVTVGVAGVLWVFWNT